MAETTKPQFEVLAPVFRVADVVRSRSYYVKKLGFECHFEWADEHEGAPRYVILRQGRTELHVSQSKQSTPSTAYVFVAGIQEYYDTVSGADAVITQQIQDFPWNMREFEVQDPDDNKLVFGEHLSRLEASTDH